MSIDLEEFNDENENRRDFRRANGAPLVSDPTDASKTLRYSRPSSYAKHLDDEEALNIWKFWKVMTGVARSPALQAQVNATKDEDRETKKKLRKTALDKGDASEKADQGNALHAMTARAEDENDTDFDPPERYVPDLCAYHDALHFYGLVSEMVEVPFVNDAYRAAGTADRVFRLTKPLVTPDGSTLEIGTLIVGDLKTGKLDFSLPGFCVQTALYATGTLYDVVTERRLPTPPIDRNWTLIVHLPLGAGHCEVRWSSVRLGLEGAELAAQVKEWQKLWKNGTHDAPLVADPVELLDRLQEELGAEMVADVPMATMSAWCQSRINAIRRNEAATKTLILRWPEGLPTPKKGITSADHIITLMNLLDKIEAEFSIPFGDPDPRLQHITGHKSNYTKEHK